MNRRRVLRKRGYQVQKVTLETVGQVQQELGSSSMLILFIEHL